MPTTVGLSPKLIGAAITGLIVFALTKFAISIDSVTEQAINVVAMLAAAYLAPPGDVVPAVIGNASDGLLSTEASAELNRAESGDIDLQTVLVLVVLVLLIVFLANRV